MGLESGRVSSGREEEEGTGMRWWRQYFWLEVSLRMVWVRKIYSGMCLMRYLLVNVFINAENR